MRILRLAAIAFVGLNAIAVIGLIATHSAPAYSRDPSPRLQVPRYNDGQLVIAPQFPDDPGLGADDQAARAAHHAAISRVYAAFDHPWSAMCAPEQRIPLVAALNDYYGARPKVDRSAGLFWTKAAPDWRTADDRHIERLTRVSLREGYVTISELDGRIVSAVEELVRGFETSERCNPNFDPFSTGIEDYRKADRDSARAEALELVTAKWVRSCSPPHHRQIVGRVEHYYKQRVEQQTDLLEQWGVIGLRRAQALFSTDADATIDNVTREMLRDGSFTLDEFHPKTHPLLASMVDKPVAHRCPADAVVARRK